MAEKPRPLSKEQAPDPSNAYERSHPERESGMGRLDNNTRATPAKSVDRMPDAVQHAQDGSRQINAHDDLQLPQSPAKRTADQSGNGEPLGWEESKRKVKKRRK